MIKLLYVLFFLTTAACCCVALTPSKIQVCQNKDCCQRFPGRAANLVQTLRQITSLVVDIESTGCLSHCDKGPNIRIIMNNNKEIVEHGVDSALAAATVLELADPELRIHPTLLAACKVMEQAQQGMYGIIRFFIIKKKWLQYI